MCDSYGSSILTQIAFDLDEDLINRDEFNEWKNKLNLKSYNFIKTNIEIYKEAKKQFFEIPFIQSIDELLDDVKQDLLKKNIIKSSETINEISDETLTFDLNKNLYP
jgi:arsenate reductase-like glutaredoxin family protein